MSHCRLAAPDNSDETRAKQRKNPKLLGCCSSWTKLYPPVKSPGQSSQLGRNRSGDGNIQVELAKPRKQLHAHCLQKHFLQSLPIFSQKVNSKKLLSHILIPAERLPEHLQQNTRAFQQRAK